MTRRPRWAKRAEDARYFRRRADEERAAGRDGSPYDTQAQGLEATIYRAKRCRDCGRELENAVSVSRGIGGDCWAKRQRRASRASA